MANTVAKKIRISTDDPQSSEIVHNALDGISSAVKAENTQYTVMESGNKYFSKLEGVYNGHVFAIHHNVPKERGPRETLYVAYDNYEFVIDKREAENTFQIIDSQINKRYLYDLNTKSYVLRPVELSFIDKFMNNIRGKFNDKSTKTR